MKLLVVGEVGYIGYSMVKILTISEYHVVVLGNLSTGFRGWKPRITPTQKT